MAPTFDWFDDLVEADAYFTDERLETEHWDALTNTQKGKVCNQAYNDLYYSKNWALPTKIIATADELIVLKKAQGEQAYFLAEHLFDMDTRVGLQAQNVWDEGSVKEKYLKHTGKGKVIAPGVHDLLDVFPIGGTGKAIYVRDIDRDENESIDTDVVNL